MHSSSRWLRFIVFLCGGLLLFSCRPKPLELEIDPMKPKLVVSSQIIPEQEMFISLTRSFSALESPVADGNANEEFIENLLVRDALITVSYLGSTDTLFMITPGIYGSLNTLQYNYGSYTLRATDPVTNEKISASTFLLPRVEFENITPRISISGSDTIISLKIRFKDIPDIRNWYVLSYYRKQDSASLVNTDISNYFERGVNQLSEFDLLSDIPFANENYEFTKELKKMKATDTIAVVLSNISEGYFKFLHTYQKSGNIVNQLTGEPINYPTNVHNGFGFFNAHNPDVRIFDLNDYR